MQETQVPSRGREVPLEEGMAAGSSILAWRIPWTEEPGGYGPQGRDESGETEVGAHSRGSQERDVLESQTLRVQLQVHQFPSE